MTPQTKEQEDNEKKQLDASIEAKGTCTSGGATGPENEEKPLDASIEAEVTESETEEGAGVLRKLLGKRAGQPSPTDTEQDSKKKKANAGSLQDRKASKEKEETPPGTSTANDSTSPATPEGRPQPPSSPKSGIVINPLSLLTDPN